MNADSEGEAEATPNRRSLRGPIAGCFLLVFLGGGCLVLLLLTGRIGGADFLLSLTRPSATLVVEGQDLFVSWEDRGRVQILLGPGCEQPVVGPSENGPALTWLANGSLCRAVLTSSPEHLGLGQVFFQGVGGTVILLPTGTCHLVDPSAKPLLRLERWEGRLGEEGDCVVFLYRHESKTNLLAPQFVTYQADDGFSFDDLKSLREGFSNERWEFSQDGEAWSRAGTFPLGKTEATYTLTTGGKTLEAKLERTYAGDWSAGDPPSPTRGY